MAITVDNAKLLQVAEMVQAEEEALSGPAPFVGKSDPTQWPALTFPTFPVTKIQAGVSPDCAFRFLSAALDGAASELLIYIYDFTDDDLIAKVKAAMTRGVSVRIMYDATETQGDEVANMKALGFRANLKTAPSFGRRQVFTVCHQKFVIVDGQTLFLGSGNWAGSGFPVTPAGVYKKGNRECLIRMDDRAVAGWFKDLFEKNWAIPEMPAPAGLVERASSSSPRRLPPISPMSMTSIGASAKTRQRFPKSSKPWQQTPSDAAMDL